MPDTDTKVEPTEVVPIVRTLAEERPDFRYESHDGSCYYHPFGDMPGCIVGQALEQFGVDVNSLESESVDCLSIWVRDSAPRSDALHWLSLVQQAQDATIPWGRAVEMADQRVAGTLSADDHLAAVREAAQNR